MNARGRILIVEDDPSIAQVARRYFEREQFRVEVVPDGESAMRQVRQPGYDVVLLDIALAGPMDGIEVCRQMRAADIWTPVIFVTARDEEIDRILGLELGADDYVTKPYSPKELVARVRAILRRINRPVGSPDDQVRVAGSVRLDPRSRRVWAGDRTVELTATEFDLLAQLMGRPGRVFARGELLALVWDYPANDTSRTVDVHIAQIRSKLGSYSPIRTVRGYGYAAEATG